MAPSAPSPLDQLPREPRGSTRSPVATALRAIWQSGWGIVHLVVWLGSILLTGGLGLISTLWVIPGVLARGDGRSAVNAFGWLVWFGPFGLIAALRPRR